jgi:hypothetical protein
MGYYTFTQIEYGKSLCVVSLSLPPHHAETLVRILITFGKDFLRKVVGRKHKFGSQVKMWKRVCECELEIIFCFCVNLSAEYMPFQLRIDSNQEAGDMTVTGFDDEKDAGSY